MRGASRGCGCREKYKVDDSIFSGMVGIMLACCSYRLLLVSNTNSIQEKLLSDVFVIVAY